MKQILFALLALGACTGEGKQIVIQLDGPVTASSVDLVFVEPHVFIKRDQRANETPLDSTPEPAFYVVQRRRLDGILDGDVPLPVDDVELRLVGADGLLPIAIARDGQGSIVGMGVLDPERVFRDDGESTENFTNHLRELADITRFPIVIEPVIESTSFGQSRPVSLAAGEVHGLKCANVESQSGLLWRPQPAMDGIRHQLRIALPLDGGDDARLRVEAEGFDLDCDNHTPANRGMIPLGDEADCDDTSALVNRSPDQREACDQIDNDCNPNSVGADVAPAMCGTCLGNKLTCLEGVASTEFESDGCTEASRCLFCPIHTLNSDGALTGCSNLGEVPLPGECGSDCVIRVVGNDPRWEIKIGDPGDPKFGLYEGYTPIANKLGIAALPVAGAVIEAGNADAGSVLLAYRANEDAKIITIEVILGIELSTTHTAPCAQPFETMPACGPNG